MYLISEARPSPAGVRAPRREAPLIEDPERDAVALMDRLYNEFHRDYGIRSYDPAFSRSDASTTTMLRSLGGATLRAQQELSIAGYRGSESPLFDGLAINLIDKLFTDAFEDSYEISEYFPRRNFLGVREAVTSQSLNTVVANLADTDVWRKHPRDENGRAQWDLGLSFTTGSWKKLTIFAEIPEYGSKASISEVKLQDGDKIPEFEGIESKFNRIILDQSRRNDLAKSYEATPVAPGLPADLRAGLKAALESIGIPNGTYSREGFSSGRFPERQTQAVLKHRTTAATHLKFNRCRCGAVRSVELQSGNRRQNAALNSFSFGQIVPWHDSFCGLLGGHAERSRAAELQPIHADRTNHAEDAL